MFREIFIGLYLITQIYTYPVHVKVKQGPLIGVGKVTVFKEQRYFAFFRVPYAKPPLGKLRFKDPVPPKYWDFPYDGTLSYLGTCAQPHIVHRKGLFGHEDCLYLNIYTPSIPKKGEDELKPVVLWIHGYAFATSFSHIYGPDLFIEKDIIFITLTHRIGVFGFAKINASDTNANMGLKDIVMGLKWVRKNVINFGGDKKRITIMASGSAATFASMLMVTKARKMFSKLILHSGAITSPLGYKAHDTEFELNKLKYELQKLTNKDLHTASTGDIVEAVQKIYNKKDVINYQRLIVPFLPTVEIKSNNSLLTEPPEKYFSTLKLRHLVPILIGFNSQEGLTDVVPLISNPHYFIRFQNNFKFLVPFSIGCSYNENSKVYKKVSKKIKQSYLKNDFSELALHRFIKYTTDIYKYPVYKFIKELIKNKVKVFAYKFNYVGRLNAVKSTATAESQIKVKGAANGDELCYLLKCHPLLEYYFRMKNETESTEKTLMKQIVEIWTNFVVTGNPTPESFNGGFSWPTFDDENHKTLLIGNNFTLTESKSEEAMYSFWNEIYDKFYAPKNCQNESHDEL